MNTRALGFWLIYAAVLTVLVLLLVNSCDASRLYPTAGFVVRYEVEADRHPRTIGMLQGAVALSLGRIAVRPTLRANHRRLEGELSVLYRIGGP